MIPMEMAKIIDIGIAGGNLPLHHPEGLHTGCDGNACPVFRRNSRKDGGNRGGGICKNLRHDIFYRVQEFSFKNIDHFYLRSCNPYDYGYYQCSDGLYDEPAPVSQSAHHGSFIMGYDSDHQSKDCAFIFSCDPRSGRRPDFYCEEGPSPFCKGFDEYDILNNSVQENVNASRVVKSFVREDYEIGKFHDISKYVYKLLQRLKGLWHGILL